MVKVVKRETEDLKIGLSAVESPDDPGPRSITGIASNYTESNPNIAELILEEGPAFIDRINAEGSLENGIHGSEGFGFQALGKVAALLTKVDDTNHRLKNRFLGYSLDLIEKGGYSLLDLLAEIIISDGPYEHEKPFQALIMVLPDIVEKSGSEVLNSIAVIGKNMSHVTWQIQHAVDFIRKIPQMIDRVNSIFEKKNVLKFFCMLGRLSVNQYNFNNIIANLDGYIASLEKCKALGISDNALDLTNLLADADSIQSQNVFQFWIDFAESIYDVNIEARDGSAHPDFIQVENTILLENLIEKITLESKAHPITASHLIGHSGRIIELIGYDGLDTVIRDYIQEIPAGSNQRSQVYLEVLKCSPDIIKSLLNLGDKKFVMDTYGLVGALNKTMHVSECTALLKRTAQVTGKIGLDGLRKILKLYKKILHHRPEREDVDYDFILLLNETPDIINAIVLRGGTRLLMDVFGHAERLARHGSKLPYALLLNAPEILKTDGLNAIEKVSRIVSEIAGDVYFANSLLKAAPEIIKSLGYDGIAQSARLGKRIWKHHGDAASIFIDTLPLHLSKLDYKGLSRLADKITETAITHRKNAELLAKGETQEYLDYCDYINEGLHLKHIRPLLSYYLEALLGYRIEISPARTADTDGKRVYLPKVVKDFKDDDKNLLMYKVQSTHVEAHIEFGSFDFQLSNVSDLVAGLVNEYKLGEGSDECHSEEQFFFALFPEPKLIQDLKDIFEDFRIESRLGDLYPVLKKDILRMNRHMLNTRQALDELSNDKERTVEIICQMLSANRTKETVPDTITPVLNDALTIAASLKLERADVHDTFRAAAAIYRRIDETFQEAYESIEPFSSPINQAQFNENIGNFSKTAERISDLINDGDNDAPGKDDGLDESEDNSMHENDRESGESDETDDHPMQDHDEQDGGGYDHDGQDPSDRKMPTDELRQMLLQLFKDKKIKPKEIERDIEDLDPDEVLEYLKNLEISKQTEQEAVCGDGCFLYPEWGNDINAYRAHWTSVNERNVVGDDPEFYNETMEKYDGLIKRIRREFQVLRPEALIKLKRQFDGNEIDFDAAVDYQIDLALNITPSEKNYIQSLKHHRDIAVAFLIDLSGSTSGKTIRCEKQSLIMLSEALNELRDTFAIYGFTGYTKDLVDFYMVKDFSETYSRRIKQRISGLTPGTNTREGAAIRHATTKLKAREEKTKILIMLNDSQPFDEGYQGDYAIADTRMAISEAKKYGIKPFCLTITKNSRHLKELYSHNSWVVIDDITKLPERITKIYQKLTT